MKGREKGQKGVFVNMKLGEKARYIIPSLCIFLYMTPTQQITQSLSKLGSVTASIVTP